MAVGRLVSDSHESEWPLVAWLLTFVSLNDHWLIGYLLP